MEKKTEMTREELPNETPREDLMNDALRHYEEASNAIHHWHSDIPAAIRAYYAPLPPSEGAKTCWNCGADIHYLPNGLPPYRCDCGAVNPEERQQQPTAEGVNCFYYDKPGKEKVISALPPAEGAEEILNKHTCCTNPYKKHEIIDAMEDFATLHAQKIAQKMVSERLREELIKFARAFVDIVGDEVAFVDDYIKAERDERI